MAAIQISVQDYEIMSSILKDGVGMHHFFTAKELLRTLTNLGFSLEKNGMMRYEGEMVFVFKPRDEGRTTISYARQDDLKRQMFDLFGWTKGTFEERS